MGLGTGTRPRLVLTGMGHGERCARGRPSFCSWFAGCQVTPWGHRPDPGGARAAGSGCGTRGSVGPREYSRARREVKSSAK